MSGKLLQSWEHHQTRAALQLVRIVVLGPVKVQFLLTEQREDANVAHEPRLDPVDALDVIVQLVRGRKLPIAVTARNAIVFVYDLDVVLESELPFELFVTLGTREAIGIAVSPLMLIPGFFGMENHSASFT